MRALPESPKLAAPLLAAPHFAAPLVGVFMVALLLGAAAGQATCGDCDERLNGVDVLDSLEAARIGVGLDSLMPSQLCACDLDGTGVVNVVDALLLAQVAAGIPVAINCGAACLGACPGTVSLSGPAAPVRCGTTTLVTLNADVGACDIGAYQFRLSWNPTVLELDDTYGVRGVQQTLVPSPGVVNDAIPGEVTFNGVFGCVSTFSSPLATIRFNVIGMPSSSSLVTLEVDELARCDTTTIGPANPRAAGGITIDVSSQSCFVGCTATGAAVLLGPSGMVDCGATFQVPLQVSLGDCDLGAFEFDLTWDPSVIELNTSFGQDGVVYSPSPSIGVVNPGTGTLRFNAIHSCPILGTSTVATIGFRAIGGAGSSTSIDLSLRDLARCDTSPIGPPTPRSGTPANVNVGGPGCGGGGVAVTQIVCGQTRSGTFPTGSQVVDVADDATTDYFELGSFPASTQEIVISTTGTGDVDLYVGSPGIAGGSQIVAEYPLRSLSFSSTEQVVLNAASSPALSAYGAGPIAIAVHAYDPGSYTLEVSCSSTPPPTSTPITCGQTISGNLSASGMGTLGIAGATEFFRLDTGSLPGSLSELVIVSGGAQGDIDLYVGLPGTAPGSTSTAGYIALDGDSSHHSYVMPPGEVASYGGQDLAIAVHADRAGDFSLTIGCFTPSSTTRYLRHYIYTVGSGLSNSIGNGTPTGRDNFNEMLSEWSRVYGQSPSPRFLCAFEVRQWSGASANAFRNLDFDTEADDLDSYTASFPSSANRPDGPHTFLVESLMAGGFSTLGISYLDRSGSPGSFGTANAVSMGASSFAAIGCADARYIFGIAGAHECGHYTNLEHTTQFADFCGGTVAFHDGYSDTPRCTTGTACGSCPDFQFMMFPVIFDQGCSLPTSARQDAISGQQELEMEANPCVR